MRQAERQGFSRRKSFCNPTEQSLAVWLDALWMLPQDRKLNSAATGREGLVRAGLTARTAEADIPRIDLGGLPLRYVAEARGNAGKPSAGLPGQLETVLDQTLPSIPKGRRGWSRNGILSFPRDAREQSLAFWRMRSLRTPMRYAVALSAALRLGPVGDAGSDRWAGWLGHWYRRLSNDEKTHFADLDVEAVLLPPVWRIRFWRRLWAEGDAQESAARIAEALWQRLCNEMPVLAGVQAQVVPVSPGQLGILGRNQPEQAAVRALLTMAQTILAGDWNMLTQVLSHAQALPLGPKAYAILQAGPDAGRKGRRGKAGRAEEAFQLATGLLLRAMDGSVADPDLSKVVDEVTAMGNSFPVSVRLEAGSASPGPVPLLKGEAAAEIDQWILAGPAPHAQIFGPQTKSIAELVLLGGATIDQAVAGRLARPGQILRLRPASDLRVPHYSAPEENLSAATARLGAVLVAELRALMPAHPPQAWLSAIELTIDDLVFGHSVDFWSLLHHLRNRPEARTGLLTHSTDWSAAFVAGLATLGAEAPVLTALLPRLGIDPDATEDRLLSLLIEATCPAAGVGEEKALAALLAREASAPAEADPAPAGLAKGTRSHVMLVGRSFDRNYHVDLAEIGRALKAQASVVFLPTAGQRGRNPLTMLSQIMFGDWHDAAVIGPLVTMSSPLHRLRGNEQNGLFDLLMRNALQRGQLDLTLAALAFAARPALEPFLARRLPQYLAAGAQLAATLSSHPVRAIVLLPGRDYLAQVATLEGRRLGVPSFDVQTVFVGPRSRYKAALADYQLAIESNSKEVFESFFGLAPSRVLLTGCAKVGVVQQKARALNPASALSKGGFGRQPLVFAGSPFLASDRPILEALAAVMPDLPGMELAIRLHPTAHDDYAAFCHELLVTVPQARIETRLDLAETLAVAEILVTRFSNVGLEAALLGRNVIACNFSGEFVPIRLDEMGVAAVARSPAELQALIADILSRGVSWQSLSASRAAYLARNPQLLLESAGQNIARTILDHSAKL